MQKTYTLLILSAFLATGCASTLNTQTMDSNYQAQAEIPSSWQESPETSTKAIQPNWWLVYQDPQLNFLIAQVLKNNHDLASARLNLEKLATQYQLEDVRWSVNSSAGGKRQIQQGSQPTDRFSAGVALNYEWDLWGKLTAQQTSNALTLKSSEFELLASQHTLVHQTIRLYYEYAYLQEAQAIQKQSLDYYQRLLQLQKQQQALGKSNRLDTQQTQAALFSQESRLQQLARQQKTTQLNLQNLLGSPANQDFSTLKITLPNQLPRTGPNLAVGLPASLLKNRPDVAAAEQKIRSAFWHIETTRLSYYPNITITGALDVASSDLINLLKNPIATLGANLALPFLKYADKKSNLKVADLDYQQTLITFRKTLLTALQEVQSALDDHQTLKQTQLLNENILKEKQASLAIYQAQYNAGKIALKPVLDAEEAARQSQLQTVQDRYDLIDNKDKIYQALGGYYEPNGNN